MGPHHQPDRSKIGPMRSNDVFNFNRQHARSAPLHASRCGMIFIRNDGTEPDDHQTRPWTTMALSFHNGNGTYTSTPTTGLDVGRHAACSSAASKTPNWRSTASPPPRPGHADRHRRRRVRRPGLFRRQRGSTARPALFNRVNLPNWPDLRRYDQRRRRCRARDDSTHELRHERLQCLHHLGEQPAAGAATRTSMVNGLDGRGDRQEQQHHQRFRYRHHPESGKTNHGLDLVGTAETAVTITTQLRIGGVSPSPTPTSLVRAR